MAKLFGKPIISAPPIRGGRGRNNRNNYGRALGHNKIKKKNYINIIAFLKWACRISNMVYIFIIIIKIKKQFNTGGLRAITISYTEYIYINYKLFGTVFFTVIPYYYILGKIEIKKYRFCFFKKISDYIFISELFRAAFIRI